MTGRKLSLSEEEREAVMEIAGRIQTWVSQHMPGGASELPWKTEDGSRVVDISHPETGGKEKESLRLQWFFNLNLGDGESEHRQVATLFYTDRVERYVYYERGGRGLINEMEQYSLEVGKDELLELLAHLEEGEPANPARFSF